VIGIWVGATLTVLGVVGYSFPGIERAMKSNPPLEQNAGFELGDDQAKKESALWVIIGELNRHYFFGWNRAQLVLAALAIFAVACTRRRKALVYVAIASVITLVLTFELAPDLTDRGRAIDFKPRDTIVEEEAAFLRVHKVYTSLEFAKTIALLAAVVLTARRGKSENAGG